MSDGCGAKPSELLRISSQGFFVAENPIGILNHDGGRTFRGLLRAIASVGYVCEWHVIAAADVGAPHLRQRVWLVAYADSFPRTPGESRRTSSGLFAASAGSQGRQDEGQAWAVVGDCGANVADAHGWRCEVERLAEHGDQQSEAWRLADRRSPWRRWQGSPELAQHWSTEPQLGRLAHGIPSRVDRLRCLGNAVVPQIVELIGRAIIEHASNCSENIVTLKVDTK